MNTKLPANATISPTLLRLRRRSGLAFALAFALGVVAGPGCSPPEPPPSFSADRGAALAARLEADTGVPWSVEVDATGAPLILSPLGRVAPTTTPGAPHAVAAVAFLSRYEDALGVPGLAAQLGVEGDGADDPAVVPDGMKGLHHVRLSQRIPGSSVKVFGGDVLAHFDDAGSLVLVQTAVTTDLAGVSPSPSVDATAAEQAAIAAVKKTPEAGAPSARVHKGPELGVHRGADNRGRLAYRVVLELDGYDLIAPEVFIDAQTAAVLSVAEHAAHASGVVAANNAYAYLPPSVTRPAGVDTTSRITIRTDEPTPFGATNRLVREGDRDMPTLTTDASILMDAWMPRAPIVSSDPSTFDRAGTNAAYGDGAAVNVHENMALTDAYLRRFGLRGWDGRNGPMTAAVRALHVERGKLEGLTAYFNDVVYFEDGVVYFEKDKDGKVGKGQLVRLPYGVALDAVAHEIMHGVTAHFADLAHIGEAGALDEGISDVLAAGVEHANRTSNDPFRIAEDAFAVRDGEHTRRPSRAALRDMREPRSLPPEADPIPGFREVPRTYDERWPTASSTDDGYTHVNSVIASHAYYLMSMGGTNARTGISVPREGALGWDRAQMLWLVTVMHGLGGPFATFKAFARVQAGLALGAGWLAPVVCAWRAVAVLSEAEVRAYGVACGAGPDLVDSCAGRIDAAYCSDVAPWSALVCRSGQIASGVQCPAGRLCRRTSAGVGSPAALDASGAVVCE